jgi:hypothetical protein
MEFQAKVICVSMIYDRIRGGWYCGGAMAVCGGNGVQWDGLLLGIGGVVC